MAQMKIDQAGLPAGVAGKSRTDGKLDGSLVTLTSTGPGTAKFQLLWVPIGDTVAVASLAPTGAGSKVWTFTPTASKPGTYTIRLIEDEGLETETISERVFRVRTTTGIAIPALNELADPYASLLLAGAEQIEASQDNATDYALSELNAHPYAGWFRILHEWILYVDGITASYRPLMTWLFSTASIAEQDPGDGNAAFVCDADPTKAKALVLDDENADALDIAAIVQGFGKGIVTVHNADWSKWHQYRYDTVANATSFSTVGITWRRGFGTWTNGERIYAEFDEVEAIDSLLSGEALAFTDDATNGFTLDGSFSVADLPPNCVATVRIVCSWGSTDGDTDDLVLDGGAVVYAQLTKNAGALVRVNGNNANGATPVAQLQAMSEETFATNAASPSAEGNVAVAEDSGALQVIVTLPGSGAYSGPMMSGAARFIVESIFIRDELPAAP